MILEFGWSYLVYTISIIFFSRNSAQAALKINNNNVPTRQVNYEEILRRDLLKAYNKKQRPPGETIEIKFALNINQIINLMVKDQIIVINAFIDHEWKDDRLAWSKT
jgi:hypothetical protein